MGIAIERVKNYDGVSIDECITKFHDNGDPENELSYDSSYSSWNEFKNALIGICDLKFTNNWIVNSNNGKPSVTEDENGFNTVYSKEKTIVSVCVKNTETIIKDAKEKGKLPLLNLVYHDNTGYLSFEETKELYEPYSNLDLTMLKKNELEYYYGLLKVLKGVVDDTDKKSFLMFS